jgi:hypothetical protein
MEFVVSDHGVFLQFGSLLPSLRPRCLDSRFLLLALLSKVSDGWGFCIHDPCTKSALDVFSFSCVHEWISHAAFLFGFRSITPTWLYFFSRPSCHIGFNCFFFRRERFGLQEGSGGVFDRLCVAIHERGVLEQPPHTSYHKLSLFSFNVVFLHKSHQKFRLSFETLLSGSAACARSAITNCIIDFLCSCFLLQNFWLCTCTSTTEFLIYRT